MPLLPGQSSASDTGHVFEGTPPWFSGAGVLRPADPFWTDPKNALKIEEMRRIASAFGKSEQEYYNSLKYAGYDPNNMSIEELRDPSSKSVADIQRAIAESQSKAANFHSQAEHFARDGAYREQSAQNRAAFHAEQQKIQSLRQELESSPLKTPEFLFKQFERALTLPGVEEKFSPYSSPPGLLKRIADIAAGRLEERAAMKPSDRVYSGDRLAKFDPAQIRAQQALEDIAGATPANNAVHQGVLGTLQSLQGENPLNAASQYLQQGSSAVTPAERALFRQSAMHDVVEPLQAKMRRDLLERILPQINTNRIMKGNLYGGGTDKLRERAIENYNRDAMEVALPHLFAAEQQGQQAGERQRQAQINAGQIMAPASVQAMGAKREAALSTSEALRNKQLQELVAAEAGTSAGAARQQQEQQALNIAAQNWEAEQAGLMDEAAQAAAIARGQQIPRMSTSASPISLSPSLSSALGQLAMGGGLMSMMQQPKTVKAGGRIKLATGGLASNNYSNFRDSLSSGDFLSRILSGGQDQSMASQAVQQDMMNQPPAPPPPAQPIGGVMDALPMPAPATPAPAPAAPAGPLERGGQSAMSALEKMNQYRDQLNQQAASLDSGAQDVNPMLPFLARTFIGAAGSKSLNLGDRLGEGAQHGYQAFEQQRTANARNKELSTNIKKGLLETYQKEHEHELAMQLKRESIKAKANAPTKPKFYYNQQTGTHYTVDENGQMVVAPGAPDPQTPKMKSEEDLSKVRQIEAVKTEEENVKKLQEDVNKSQRSIGNYNTMISLLKDTGINKYIGPIKGKIYSNPKVQALLLNKNAVSEIKTFVAATNKAVLDDIKLTGSQPSDRDVKIVQDSKPSETDTPQSALKKALINRTAYERNRDFANFTKKMWREKGWPSYKSQEVYNRWQQANPMFGEDGQVILKPKDRPEDHENDQEESHDIIGEPDYGPDEVVTPYAPQANTAQVPTVPQLRRDHDKIKAAIAAKRALSE